MKINKSKKQVIDKSRNQLIITLIIFFGLFAMVRNSQAAPSISGVSGTVSNGNPITISGSGFGTHADNHDANQTGQLNWIWQTWRDNVLESNGFSCGTTPASAYWSMSGASPRIDSTTFARRYNTGGGNDNMNGEQKNTIISPPPGKYFISYWFRVPINSSSAGKIIRFSSSNFDVGDFWLATCGGLGSCGSNDVQLCWGGSDGYTFNTWQRVDLYLDATNNTEDMRIVGVNSNQNLWNGQNYGCGSQDISNISASAGGNFGVNVGAGIDPGSAWDFSDLYVDFTPARVEICDSSSWVNRTHCEIQIPSAWSSNAATVSINQGSFADSANAYLYVVDSAGAANASGYPITFGPGSSDTTAPSAPSGLSVL